MLQQKLATELWRECSSDKLHFRRLITDSVKEHFFSSILSFDIYSLLPRTVPSNFRSFSLACVSMKLCNFSYRAMTKCCLEPKNHTAELFPHFINQLKISCIEVRLFPQALYGVESINEVVSLRYL